MNYWPVQNVIKKVNRPECERVALCAHVRVIYTSELFIYYVCDYGKH